MPANVLGDPTVLQLQGLLDPLLVSLKPRKDRPISASKLVWHMPLNRFAPGIKAVCSSMLKLHQAPDHIVIKLSNLARCLIDLNW